MVGAGSCCAYSVEYKALTGTSDNARADSVCVDARSGFFKPADCATLHGEDLAVTI